MCVRRFEATKLVVHIVRNCFHLVHLSVYLNHIFISDIINSSHFKYFFNSDFEFEKSKPSFKFQNLRVYYNRNAIVIHPLFHQYINVLKLIFKSEIRKFIGSVVINISNFNFDNVASGQFTWIDSV